MNTTNSIETAIYWKEKAVNYLFEHGGAIVAAIFILIAGAFIASWAAKIVLRSLGRKHLEPPLQMLISRVVRLIVMILATLVALQTCGVDLLPLIAGMGVVGVGIGLAMQGVLGNLMAGLTIIFTKPFRIGEYIDLLGEEGVVTQIELFVTTLSHPDRSRVIIPNRKIVGEVLHNYGTIRQLNLEVGVAYSTDLAKAQAAVREVLAENPRVLKDPVPYVGVTMLSDSSIVISVKPWTNVTDFGMARIELNQAIVEKFRIKEVSIPFPQREIRVLNQPSAA
jgi:small conductance mechanosensitive channel